MGGFSFGMALGECHADINLDVMDGTAWRSWDGLGLEFGACYLGGWEADADDSLHKLPIWRSWTRIGTGINWFVAGGGISH